MSARIAMVTNTRSYKVAKHGSVIISVASDFPDIALLSIGDFALLPKQILSLAQSGVSVFFIEGGDGTVEGVISACLVAKEYFHSPPCFAILPGGSTNLAFKVMGLRKTNKMDICCQIARLSKGSMKQVYDTQRALLIKTAASETARAGFLLSTGSLARAMLYTQASLHKSGPRGSLSIMRAAAQLALWPEQTLYTDGLPVIKSSLYADVTSASTVPKEEHTFTLMTTLPHLSLGLKPFWSRDDHTIVCTHAVWPITGLRQAVGRVLIGSNEARMAKHGVSSKGVEWMSFYSNGSVILDGEILPEPEDGIYHVTSTPELRFLR